MTRYRKTKNTFNFDWSNAQQSTVVNALLACRDECVEIPSLLGVSEVDLALEHLIISTIK